MQLLGLAAEFVAVTCIGALSPGPLTLAVAGKGAEEGWCAGAKAAMGHVAVEFPLVILAGVGASALLAEGRATTLISVVGGAALLVFALLFVKNAADQLRGRRSVVRVGNITLGAAFSLLNPHFIAWWATAGLKVVADVVSYGGLALLALLYPLHAGIDAGWLALVAHASHRGAALNERVGPALSIIAALLMACYGVMFILEAL